MSHAKPGHVLHSQAGLESGQVLKSQARNFALRNGGNDLGVWTQWTRWTE